MTKRGASKDELVIGALIIILAVTCVVVLLATCRCVAGENQNDGYACSVIKRGIGENMLHTPPNCANHTLSRDFTFIFLCEFQDKRENICNVSRWVPLLPRLPVYVAVTLLVYGSFFLGFAIGSFIQLGRIFNISIGLLFLYSALSELPVFDAIPAFCIQNL